MRPLSVAIVYDDNDTHRQATAVWEFLVQQLGEGADLTGTWWRTSLLGDPRLGRAAAKAVSASDLILVSLHSGREPAPALRTWIESLPSSMGRPTKLLALLHDRSGAFTAEWPAYLKEWAKNRKIVYLEGTAAAFVDSPAPQAERPRAILKSTESMRIEPYAHWGLNE